MARAKESLVLLGGPPPDDLRQEISKGLSPREKYIEIADLLNGAVLSAADAPASMPAALANLVAGRTLLASALTAFGRRSEFDAIYVTGEDIGMRLAPLLRAAGWRGRLVMVVHACTSKPRKAYLRALGRGAFHALITVCEIQRRILIDEVGYAPDQVWFCPNWVDTEFFAPMDGQEPGGYVYSCGRENRDYASLFAAAAGLPVPFKVTASGFRHDGGGLETPPDNVSLSSNRVSFAELRANYGGARFVVVPLHPVDYAAGVTGVVEAMAMGKAVIATASPGILDYVEDGVTGRVVPSGDPAALTAAIADLWADPAGCAVMGARNRAWARANADTRVYARTIARLMKPGSAAPVARPVAVAA